MHPFLGMVPGPFCIRLLAAVDAPPTTMQDSPWQDAGFTRERTDADWLRADALRYGTTGGAVTTAFRGRLKGLIAER